MRKRIGAIIMGFFDKFKKKEIYNFDLAYEGKPEFYVGKDGKPFGVFALTENTLTTLPKDPKAIYKIDNINVDTWKLMLVSTSENGILGDLAYYEAIHKLKKFVVDERNGSLLIKSISLDDLKKIL